MVHALTHSAPQAPCLVEPAPSYFSRYRDYVTKELHDFLATRLLEAGQDLEKRVAVVRTAIGALFIAEIFAVRYRREEQESIYTLIGQSHQHCHLMQPTLSLPKEEMLRLCDVRTMKEEEYIFSGDLSIEKNQIQLLMQEPKTQKLIKYIVAVEDKFLRAYAIACLFVILGIKPACLLITKLDYEVCPPEMEILIDELITLLKEICGEHLIFKEDGSNIYFVNEQPLPSFDPRLFLTLKAGLSLTELLRRCFNELNNSYFQAATLSYLLGYGPTFESFFVSQFSFLRGRSVKCFLNKNHYYEIGKVLYQQFFHKVGDNLQLATLAFAYHSQLALLDKLEHSREMHPVQPVEDLLHRTGTICVVDGLAARTDYFKKSYTLKKWVMETYFSELND